MLFVKNILENSGLPHMQLGLKPDPKSGEQKPGGRLGSDLMGFGLVMELVQGRQSTFLCSASAHLCAKQAAAPADKELPNEA